MSQVFIQTGRYDCSSLSIRSGQLTGTYHFGSITQSITGCLRAFHRQLYYGYMHRDVFLYGHYLHAKDNLIKQMLTPDLLTERQQHNLGFCMYMSRVAQNQEWRYPALLNRDPLGRIAQITGSTRAFASLLVHERPWERYPVLLAEHPDFDPAVILKDPVLIDDDRKLHEVLKLNPDAKEWISPVEIMLRVEPTADGLWCWLDYIGNGTYHDHNPAKGLELLGEYRAWHKKYTKPIPLAVYTQWPHLLLDRLGIWQIQTVGTSQGLLLDERPGTAERAVRAYHQSPGHTQDHVLWVIEPRPIDLADLLFWLDNKHSTYISNDWSFILWRRQPDYINTFITVPRPAD